MGASGEEHRNEQESLADRLAGHVPAEGHMRPLRPYHVPEQRQRPPDAPLPLSIRTQVAPAAAGRRAAADPTLLLRPPPTRLSDHPRPLAAVPGAHAREERPGLRGAVLLASATLLVGAGVATAIVVRRDLATERASMDAPFAEGSRRDPSGVPPLDVAPIVPVAPAAVEPAPVSIAPVTTPSPPPTAAPPPPTSSPPVTRPAASTAQTTTSATLNPPNRPVPPTRPDYTTSTTAAPQTTTSTTAPKPTTTTSTTKQQGR